MVIIMKKIISILLSATIIIGGSIAILNNTDLSVSKKELTREYVSKAEAVQFADEVKQLENTKEAADCRLIVSADKEIDSQNAVQTATGINGLYVMQYSSENEAKKAYDYYNSLSYVNYVDYDCFQENAILEYYNDEEQDNFDYKTLCASTANCNIDDAIKLVHQEYPDLPEMKVAVCDSIAFVNKFTRDRIKGRYSFFTDTSGENSTETYTHGTSVSSTIILNTMDNVKLYTYELIDKNNNTSITYCISAIYLAVSEGCRVINMSLKYITTVTSNADALKEAVNYATEQGTVVVCAAGNDSKDLSTYHMYPAIIPNAITVGALDRSNKTCDFSNYGKVVDIYSTGYGLTQYTTSGDDLFMCWAGTSASTPVVSSIVALLLSIKPDLTAQEIEKLFLETGDSTNDSNESEANKLISDAYEAVKFLTGKELKAVSIEYTLNIDPDKNSYDLSFSSDDDATIYYNTDFQRQRPCRPFKDYQRPAEYDYLYEKGTTLNFGGYRSLALCAYAPGKAKSHTEFIMVPNQNKSSGFTLTKSDDSQDYNTVSYCNLNSKIIEVPEEINYFGINYEIQEIGEFCFMGNQTVETIIIPESIKKINAYAFANCPNLKNVIALGVTECDKYAFYDCENLTEVNIPYLTTANTGLFKNCKSLETAKLGVLTQICNHAFFGCEKLKSIKTTNDDISFASRTFYNCNHLTITAPDGSSMANWAIENNIPLITTEESVCEHPNIEIIKNIDSTCTKQGLVVYQCPDCYYTYKEYPSILPHQYICTFYSATCTAYEHKVFTCEKCGYTYTDITGDTLQPHEFSYRITRYPTLTRTGRKGVTCLNCSTKFPDIILPALAPNTVTGRIITAEDSEYNAPNSYPLANANITINNDLVAVTDETGIFSANLVNGEYTAYITHPNGIDRSFTFTINDGSISVDDIAVIACDWHKDGVINAKDYAMLSKNYIDNIKIYDLNHDGIINEIEKNIFINTITKEQQ